MEASTNTNHPHASGSDKPQNHKPLQSDSGTILINRYLIHEVLGIGGMGSVYKARDLHFSSIDKYVAIKEIINQAPDPVLRTMNIQNFEHEAGILASLDHPSIPVILDYFSIEDRSYLVLEYINGKDLEVTISESPGFLSEDLVLGWAIDLCDVLDYLHSHKPDPIIFRDVKPSNIMINSQGKIILIDFGIAKSFLSGEKGTIMGTEGYSAPEQYRGVATPLVDIYALGATLHHALSGRDPSLEPHFSYNESQLSRINPSISPDFETIIAKALQYKPEDRFQSVSSMKAALIEAREQPAIKKSMVNIASQSHRDIAPIWTYRCEDEIRGSITYYEDSILFGSYDHNLYSIQAKDGNLNWIYPTEAGIVSQPAIFESETYIGSEDQRLHVISNRTGKITWSYYTGGKVRSSPRIAEGHVFVGSDDSHLHAINLLSGRAVWRFEAASPIHSTPFITRDMIYFGSEGGVFYSLDFHGEIIWTYATKIGITSSPSMSDGMVYFASRDGYIYALDSLGGWVKWRFHMSKGSNSSPCLKEGILYIGSADGNIYALDTRTGKEIWRFLTSHQVSSTPVIYKDAIYCGSTDGYLYCLDSQTGTLRWKFLTQGAITGTPVIANDIVFVGSLDHTMYALPT